MARSGVARFLLSLAGFDSKNPVTAIDAHTVRLNGTNLSPIWPIDAWFYGVGILDSKAVKAHATANDPWAGDWMQSANDAAAVVPAITDALHALLVARADAPINVSTVMAGQRLGLKEVDDGVWVVTFMAYDLGYIDLEQKTLQPIDNPFGTRVSPMS